MSKEKQVTIKMNTQSALEILQVLDSSTYGYSQEFAPERIVRLREVMNHLSNELQKVLI
jgi:hypothetical protein